MHEQLTKLAITKVYSDAVLYRTEGEGETPYTGPDEFRMTVRLLTTKETFIGIARGVAGYVGLPQKDGSFLFPDKDLMFAEFAEMRALLREPSPTQEFFHTHTGIVYRVWSILRRDQKLMETLQQPWDLDPENPTNIGAVIETAVLNHYIVNSSG